MSKRLSVIVPGYNTPKAWWKRCVDSVLTAIGRDDEIIVVDDGSNPQWMVDGGWWPDKRVRVLRKENGGLSSARNAGMTVAQGEYVTFVDSDDEVISGVYERSISRLKVSQSDVCIYGVRTVWVDEDLQKINVCGETVYDRLSVEDIRKLSDDCLMNCVWHKVYRMDFLHRNRLSFDLDGMPCEDIIFNLACVCAGAKWCAVDFVGYVYYRTHGTLLSKYKGTGFAGVRHCADAWCRLRESCGRVTDVSLKKWLDAQCALPMVTLLRREWRNIWMPGTPYSLAARWKWLKVHPEVGGFWAYSKMALYAFLRRNCYWRPVRRWNVRRLYPYATDIERK